MPHSFHRRTPDFLPVSAGVLAGYGGGISRDKGSECFAALRGYGLDQDSLKSAGETRGAPGEPSGVLPRRIFGIDESCVAVRNPGSVSPNAAYFMKPRSGERK